MTMRRPRRRITRHVTPIIEGAVVELVVGPTGRRGIGADAFVYACGASYLTNNPATCGVVGRHTAEGDAIAAGQIFLALLPALRGRGFHTVADLVWFQGRAPIRR